MTNIPWGAKKARREWEMTHIPWWERQNSVPMYETYEEWRMRMDRIYWALYLADLEEYPIEKVDNV